MDRRIAIALAALGVAAGGMLVATGNDVFGVAITAVGLINLVTIALGYGGSAEPDAVMVYAAVAAFATGVAFLVVGGLVLAGPLFGQSDAIGFGCVATGLAGVAVSVFLVRIRPRHKGGPSREP